MSVEIRERPIIFSAPMVRAILEGRKTQTRRVVKPSRYMLEYAEKKCGGESWDAAQWNDTAAHAARVDLGQGLPSPYGAPGDRLWVREAWRLRGKHTDSATPFEVAANSAHYSLWYESDCRRPDGSEAFNLDDFGRCRSPIHMPRWASRITLEIVSVRVERLREITHEDAIAEGLVLRGSRPPGEAISGFSVGWDTIHAKHPERQWQANPWVWRIEFRRT